MNIEIKTFEDMDGNLQTGLVAEKLSIEELLRLGPVIGRLITMSLKEKTNCMAVLKQIYTSAGWQIVTDFGEFVSDEEDKVSDLLLEDFIKEKEQKGLEKELFVPRK